MKKQALSLAVMIVGAYPAASNALSLGDIESNSNLNQPLRAKIELLAAGAQEAQQLQVRLAPSSVFNRVGIDRPAFLDSLKFTSTVQNGKPIILVTSDVPIAEPFVNFLLEVTWPQGQLLKEYTVMLDPPVLMQPGNTLAGSEAAVRAEPRSTGVVNRPAPRPAAQPQAEVEQQSELAAQPSAQARQVQAQPRRNQQVNVQRQAPRQQQAQAARADNRTYRVRQGDTLFKVASQLGQPGTNVDQVMMALYRANPQAFIDGNINGLRTGAVLKAPQSGVAQSVTRAEARRQVRQQYADWKKFRATLAKNTAPQQPTGDAKTERPAAPAKANRATDEKARLEVLGNKEKAAANDQVSAAGKARLADLEKELSLARETLVTNQRENSDLKSRVDELESMLRKKNRLIALRDDQLAELQRQMGGAAPATPVTTEQAGMPDNGNPVDQAAQNNQVNNPNAMGNTPEPVAPVNQQPDQQPAPPVTSPDVSQAKPDGSDIQNYIGNVQNNNEVVRAQPPVQAGMDNAAMTPAQRAAAAANGGNPNLQAMTPAQRAAAGGNLDPQAMTPAQRAAAGMNNAAPAAPAAPVAPVQPPVAPVDVNQNVGTAVKPASPFAEPQANGGGIMDLLTSPLVWKIGAGALLSLLLLWLLSRVLGRRKAAAASDSDVDFADHGFGSGQGADHIPGVNTRVKDDPSIEELGKALKTAETSGPSGLDGFGEEDDPFGTGNSGRESVKPTSYTEEKSDGRVGGKDDEVLMEATVYIAYGLHQQAESELKKALEKHPECLEYRHKLLENYFAANNREAFDEHAALFADTKGADRSGELWKDIAAWGSKISPDNRLYAKGGAASGLGKLAAGAAAAVAGAATVAAVSAKDAVAGAGDTVKAAASAVTESSKNIPSDLDVALGGAGDDAGMDDFDFDLDDLERELGGSDHGFSPQDTPRALASTTRTQAGQGGDDLDFNLDELTAGMPQNGVNSSLDDGLDNFDFDDPASAADAALAKGGQAIQDGFDEIDLDFGDLGADTPARPVAGADDANNVLDFDLDSLTMTDEPVSGSAAAAAGMSNAVDKANNVTSLNLHLDKDSGIKKILPQDTFYTTPEPPNPDDDWLGDIDEALSFLDMPDEEIDLHEAHISTKLDLARAYLDMGDIEGARSTLEEVMVEGNDNQRREAETLLHQTG